jgi:hypothetical protein
MGFFFQILLSLASATNPDAAETDAGSIWDPLG